jgi:tyrosine-protein kinase Etk/Wzc
MYMPAEAHRVDSQQPLTESSLLDVIDVLRDRKWLIATMTCVGLAAALVYIALAPATYEAATLIQVDESKAAGPTAASAYIDAATLFENHSPAVAEISVLRSGVILGEVIDRLGLDLSVRPKNLPVIGQWLARHSSTTWLPAMPGLRGYVRGSESIQVSRFVVPPDAEGKAFSVVLGEGDYSLRDRDGAALLTGTIGQLGRFKTASGPGEILVAAASGAPGGEFKVERLPRASVIEKLQRDLKIEEQGRQSGMLRMRLAGNNPELVARTLNEIARSYVTHNIGRRTGEAEKALGFVENMLPDLRTQIAQAEGKLTRLRNQYGAFDITAEGRLALEQSVQMQNKLVDLQTKRKDLASNLFDDHPSIRGLDAQISSVRAELGTVNKHIKLLPSVEQDVIGLSRDLKVKSDLYVNLLNSAQQIRLAKDGRVGNVRVVDPAWASSEPVGATPPALLAAGTTGGLVLGVLLALLRNGVRRGVQDPDWIDSRTDMSVVTTVPFSKAQKRLAKPRRRKQVTAPLLAIRAPDDPAVESLRSMRTALQRKMPGARSNVVVITGPTHAVGKSFTSTNLAAVLGASGRRVLLIDADMRKGHLNETFQVAAVPGLSDVLVGKDGIGDAMHRQVVPNVDLITAGTRTSTPSDLLTGRSAEMLLSEVSRAYDYVLVDTPPVLAASDAATIAQWAGAVFLVARAEVTSLRELHEAEKRLWQRGIEVDGVVYGGIDASKRRNDIYSYGGYEYLIGH